MLKNKIVLYIPLIPYECQSKLMRFIKENYKGYTRQQCEGNWKDNNRWITETINTYTIFTNDEYHTKLYNFLVELAKETNQKCMSYEVNNVMDFVYS